MNQSNNNLAMGSFCHTMLCSVGTSIHLSITFMYSVETRKHIFRILSPSDSHTILVFLIKCYGNIPMGASNAGGVGKKCDS